DGLERVALRLTRTRGPVTPAWLAGRYGVVEDAATQAIERLTAQGLVRRGDFLADRPGPQYVHVAVLEEIQRRQVHARRVPRPVATAEIDAQTKNVFLHLQLRGASFAQDLTRCAGLGAPEVLSALWRLFWVGFVTPDTFSAIVAGTATAKRLDAAPAARRRRRGLARGVLRQLPVIGRWSALGEEDRRSPEESPEARAPLLLSRYGGV